MPPENRMDIVSRDTSSSAPPMATTGLMLTQKDSNGDVSTVADNVPNTDGSDYQDGNLALSSYSSLNTTMSKISYSSDTSEDDKDEEYFSSEESRSSLDQATLISSSVSGSTVEETVVPEEIRLEQAIDPVEEFNSPKVRTQYKLLNINEAPYDRGSRPNSRIKKSWPCNSPHPKGLLNTGVSCYMSAALQNLLHIPCIFHFLKGINAGIYPEISSSSVTREIANLHYSLLRDKLFPSALTRRLHDINPLMSLWEQEDSHEYLTSLISRMQEDSTALGKNIRSSIIHEIFGGTYEQQVTCLECQTVSVTYQDFYDMPVSFSSIPHKKRSGYTLKGSIDQFFEPAFMSPENHGDGNGYACSICKRFTSAMTTSRMEDPPEYLPINIKRFDFQGSSCHKIKDPIEYPMILDLTAHCVDKSIPAVYKLNSLTVHIGSTTTNGHYYAYCRQPNGTFSLYDDDKVRRVSDSSVLREQHLVYYLIYTRLTPVEIKRQSKHKGRRSKPQHDLATLDPEAVASPSPCRKGAPQTQGSLEKAGRPHNSVFKVCSGHQGVPPWIPSKPPTLIYADFPPLPSKLSVQQIAPSSSVKPSISPSKPVEPVKTVPLINKPKGISRCAAKDQVLRRTRSLPDTLTAYNEDQDTLISVSLMEENMIKPRPAPLPTTVVLPQPSTTTNPKKSSRLSLFANFKKSKVFEENDEKKPGNPSPKLESQMNADHVPSKSALVRLTNKFDWRRQGAKRLKEPDNRELDVAA